MSKRVYSRSTKGKHASSDSHDQKRRRYNTDAPNALAYTTPFLKSFDRPKHRSRGTCEPVDLNTMGTEKTTVLSKELPTREKQDIESERSEALGANEESIKDEVDEGSSGDEDWVRRKKEKRMMKLVNRAFKRREYRDSPNSPPSRTVLGTSLGSKSLQFIQWSENQTQSPLLTLPRDVRMHIYHLLFGNKTIVVDYQTYVSEVDANESMPHIRPVFRYVLTYLDCPRNLRLRRLRIKLHSVGMTLLNRVCRQLWLETRHRPFANNRVAFVNHNIMYNFLVFEKRFEPHQLAAMTTLYVAQYLPSQAVLGMMPNLKYVELGESGSKDDGIYRVQRRKGKAFLKKIYRRAF